MDTDLREQAERRKAGFAGRKTFFVGADREIVSDAYLESFLALGFEAYRVFEQHSARDLYERLELICSLFGSVAFAFYVDAFDDEIDWRRVLRALGESRPGLSLAAMYTERALEGENRAVEEAFAPLCGGNFARLSFLRQKNFRPLAACLSRLGSGGMRRTVRALCGGQSSVTFQDGGERVQVSLLDISLSHFSCMMPDDLRVSGRYADAVLQVNGIRFLADCAFMTERTTSRGRMCVFAFVRKGGGAGLDDASLLRLRPKLYQMVTQDADEEMKEAFALRTKFLKEGRGRDGINESVVAAIRGGSDSTRFIRTDWDFFCSGAGSDSTRHTSS